MNADEIKAQARRYSMVIQWNDRDQVYVVSAPEWETYAGLHGHTHGGTYYNKAVHAGITRGTIARLEAGRGASAPTVKKLADALGLSGPHELPNHELLNTAPGEGGRTGTRVNPETGG